MGLTAVLNNNPDWEMAEPAVRQPRPPADGRKYRRLPCTCKKSRRPRSNARWSEEDLDLEEPQVAVPRPRPKRSRDPAQSKSLASRLRDIPGLQIMKVAEGRPRRGKGRTRRKEGEGGDGDGDEVDDDDFGANPLDSFDEEDAPAAEMPVAVLFKEEPGGVNGDAATAAHSMGNAQSASKIAAAASRLPDIPAESVFREETPRGDRLVACMALLRDFLGEQGITGYDLTVLKRFEALVKTSLSKSGLTNGDNNRERRPESASEANNFEQNGMVEPCGKVGGHPAENMDGIEEGTFLDAIAQSKLIGGLENSE